MNVEFAFPFSQLHWWLGLALAVMSAIVGALLYFEKRRRQRLERFIEAQLASRLLLGYDPSVRKPLFWLSVAGFLALALAFAQPHWGQAWHEVRRQSHDIVVCLDVSESMNAQNPLPSRLERAKQKILSLLDQAPGDRFALVVFAGAPVLESPLTHDLGYFKSVLNSVDTDSVSLEGTDIAAALHEAVSAFDEPSDKEESGDINSRAILLISDGEQVSGDAMVQAEKAAKAARVYVIGVGDPNGTEVRLPERISAYAGANVPKTRLSKLDEETLSKVALAGKGGYVRSTADLSDIGQIHDYIEQLAVHTSASDVRLRLMNRYQWPLAVAIFCLAAEGFWLAMMPLLRNRRMRRLAGESPHA